MRHSILRGILRKAVCVIIECLANIAYDITNFYYLIVTIYYSRKQGQRYKDFVSGIRAGENRFCCLSQKLIADKRYEELKIAAQDKEFRVQLYDEYDMCHWY